MRLKQRWWDRCSVSQAARPKTRQRNLRTAKPQPAPVSVPGHNKNNMSCFWPPRNLQKSCNRQSALPHQMVWATLFYVIFSLHFVMFFFWNKKTITIVLNFLPSCTRLRETICYRYGQTDRLSLTEAKRWRKENCSKCHSVKRSTWIVHLCLLLRQGKVQGQVSILCLHLLLSSTPRPKQ